MYRSLFCKKTKSKKRDVEKSIINTGCMALVSYCQVKREKNSCVSLFIGTVEWEKDQVLKYCTQFVKNPFTTLETILW